MRTSAIFLFILLCSTLCLGQEKFSPLSSQMSQLIKEKELLKRQKIHKIIIDEYQYSFGKVNRFGRRDSVFEFDNNLNLIRRESDFDNSGSANKIELFKYDRNNNLIEYALDDLRTRGLIHQNANGVANISYEHFQVLEKTVMQYDKMNRLLNKTKYCSKNEICEKSTYSYNDQNNFIQIKEYDQSGKLNKTYIVDPLEDQKKKEQVYLKKSSYGGRYVTRFEYDNNGNLLRVEEGNDISYVFRMNFNGRYLSGNIRSHKYNYDDRGDLAEEILGAFKYVIKNKYIYDQKGNVIQIIESHDEEPVSMFKFTYINNDAKIINDRLYNGRIINSDSLITINTQKRILLENENKDKETKLAQLEIEKKERQPKQIEEIKNSITQLIGDDKKIFIQKNNSKFTLLCGGFILADNAQNRLRMLNKEDVITEFVEKAIGGTRLFLVYFGLFQSKEDAEQMMNYLKSKYSIDLAVKPILEQ